MLILYKYYEWLYAHVCEFVGEVSLPANKNFP